MASDTINAIILPRFPAQPTNISFTYPLYVVLLLLLWMERRLLDVPLGRTFLVAAEGYSAIRFGLTFFRQESLFFWGLQEAQVVPLATGLLVVALIFLQRSHFMAHTSSKESQAVP